MKVPAQSRREKKLAIEGGFTLLELLAALTIVGIVLAVSVPSMARFYESMQYREAIRDVMSTLESARYAAVNRGEIQDVMIHVDDNTLVAVGRSVELPALVSLSAATAGELNSGNAAVIRFYPEGGASGGEVILTRDNGDNTVIAVDWLLGRVSHKVAEEG